ncbi:nitrite/sulfite reductase [uncultured Ferrovibrio sp.]|jgi:sulfite reductase (NADPH) hemoprotein beta-component|uniref:nitrite/sulfite reductase n=1 Tax=uncultured Ferrovibrio sp. TaxID=1576913 RepID=UPI00260BCFFB|nr:nitrite/sulfite reductase [uncultured Ferrovibrio sp.]
MYKYDQLDQTIVEERVAQFRDQVARRIAGELSEDEFKPLRLQNGLYLQLHAYMLRVAIPYGVLSSRQLRQLAHIACRYDRGWGHFTTRQNIQFNWIKLEEAPDALADLAKVQMHAIQTSGNCIRNTTTDQFAGAAADEIEDPRVWCEIIRQWSTFHPEFSFLPRKFKIAVTGSPNDRAAVRVHDIGLRMHKNARGEVGFEVIVGGGLGRTPFIGKTIRDFLPKQHLLSYLEAILRVYNQFGRRDNMYKARIKVLVHEIGIEAMREKVEAEWQAIKDGALQLPQDLVDQIAAHFAPPPFETLPAGIAPEYAQAFRTDFEFGLWARRNTAKHKQPGYAIVTISLKKEGEAPGDASAEQMQAVADIADRYSFGEIRVTHEQNLVLPHVKQADLPAVWRALKAYDLATPNVGLASDIIACPGLDYCALANARSIPVAQQIALRFKNWERAHDIGELKIKISGCINACGHHHVGHIGILGVDKAGEEYYQVTLGGSADQNASLGDLIGPGLDARQVVDAIDAIVETYLRIRQKDEIFLDTYRRVGLKPFKEAVYAAA